VDESATITTKNNPMTIRRSEGIIDLDYFMPQRQRQADRPWRHGGALLKVALDVREHRTKQITGSARSM
jgi:hypothetical protein